MGCETLSPSKSNWTDFALFGGAPTFSSPVHVGTPNIPNRSRFLRRVGEALDRRWLTNDGQLVQQFERQLCGITGSEHCIATCNATMALQLLAKALDFKGEVIMPAFTFVATAHAMEWEGLAVRFCDVDPMTGNIDVDDVCKLIGPKTAAVVGVHVWGQPCDVTALEAVAQRHSIPLILDAAHALAVRSQRGPVGGAGIAEVFSFHATKFIHSFEGGVISTNDSGLAAKLRRMRNFGFAGYDDVTDLGTNAKMNEISAAMGISCLEHLTEWTDHNRAIDEVYRTWLADIPGLRFALPAADHNLNYQYVPLIVTEAEHNVSRDLLMELLWSENVRARRYFYPGCHRMEPYASRQPDLQLPHTDSLARSALLLPTGTAVTCDMARTIAGLVRWALQNAGSMPGREHMVA